MGWTPCDSDCQKRFKVTTKASGTGTCANLDLSPATCTETEGQCVFPVESSSWLPSTPIQWVAAVVTVVPAVIYGCYRLYAYCFPKPESTIVIEEPEEETPAKVEIKSEASPAKPVCASPAQAKSPPAKKAPVVVAPKTNNNIIIGLIVACIIGMLITGYFVCIKKDEEDSDIENPLFEAPASGT